MHLLITLVWYELKIIALILGIEMKAGATRFCEVRKNGNISYLKFERIDKSALALSLPRKGKNRELQPLLPVGKKRQSIHTLFGTQHYGISFGRINHFHQMLI